MSARIKAAGCSALVIVAALAGWSFVLAGMEPAEPGPCGRPTTTPTSVPGPPVVVTR